MGQYSRHIQHESEFSDLVDVLVTKHPKGITVGQLMRLYPDQLKAYSAILPALELLAEKGKIKVEKSGGHDDPLDVYKAYPMTGK
jgi:hypothetical protein